MSKLLPDDTFIVKKTDYFNQHGMHIEHREIFYASKDATEFKKGHVEFVGHGGIPVMDDQGNPDSVPFEFAIAASTLNEAFNKFRVACNLKGNALKQEISAEQNKLKDEAPRIVLPS